MRHGVLDVKMTILRDTNVTSFLEDSNLEPREKIQVCRSATRASWDWCRVY